MTAPAPDPNAAAPRSPSAHGCCGPTSPGCIELPEGHVVRTLMEEHQRILAHLERLEGLVGGAAPDPAAAEGRARLEDVRGVAEHLIGAEPHHQREEQVLFPALMRRGIAGPPSVMEAEHVELRALKHAVADGSRALLDGGAADGAWPALRRDAAALVELLREHIWKEDSVLYPMALRAIPEPEEWEEMRRRCDAIGYCCQGH